MNVITADEVNRKIGRRPNAMTDARMENILYDIFMDTYILCSNEPLLSFVKKSMENQRIYPAENTIQDAPVIKTRKRGCIKVSKKRTLNAAAEYKDMHTAVLNFGSALSPGGYLNGKGKTQEDCLCRESTLYSCLKAAECENEFYGPHQTMDPLYNDDLIYTPDVMVFKSSENRPKMMARKDWFPVDVITMAAPNVSAWPVSAMNNGSRLLLKLFEFRFDAVMKRAMKYDVKALILGAFGCGECGNDPVVVATAAARSLEKYRYAFDTVEFAIYEPRSSSKYHMFRLILDRYILGEDS